MKGIQIKVPWTFPWVWQIHANESVHTIVSNTRGMSNFFADFALHKCTGTWWTAIKIKGMKNLRLLPFHVKIIKTYSTSLMLGSAYHPSKPQILQTTVKGNNGWIHFRNSHGCRICPGPPNLWSDTKSSLRNLHKTDFKDFSYLIMSLQCRQVAQSARIHAWQILQGTLWVFPTFSDLTGE